MGSHCIAWNLLTTLREEQMGSSLHHPRSGKCSNFFRMTSFPLPPKDRHLYLREEEKYGPQWWRPTRWAQEAAVQCWRGPSHAARVHNDGLLGSNVLLIWNNHPKAFHAQVRNGER